MNSLEAYELEKVAIEAISDQEVREPSMPIDVFVQEAHDLYNWCLTDKAALVAEGLDASIIDTLPQKALALSYAQSVWNVDFATKNESQVRWNQILPQGVELRATMMHYFRFAYRNNSELLENLKRIEEGSGNTDTIQDLSDLAALGKANKMPLLTTTFDVAMLDTAMELASEMAGLLGSANGDRRKSSELKIFRDKAYTSVKESVDNIRTVGKFVFWRSPDRLFGYSSAYIAKKNSKKTVAAE